jgi:HK97 family phage major capsid protein
MTETLSGSKRLDWLKRQMDQALADVETITSRAADEDRELSDSEVSTCEARRSRIVELEPSIKVEADLAQRSATYQDMVSHIGTAPAGEQRKQTVERSGQPEQVYETPGQYLVDYVLSRSTEEGSPAAKQRFEKYLQRAVAHQTTAQNPGLLPVSILGPVFTQQSQRRPAIEATTRRPLPGPGKTFQRPRITQNTLAGPQSAEKAELPSRNMTVDPITVTKSTYGGTINLSWQDRDWTDPAIMDLLVSDMAASYFQETDKAFCAYFAGAITATQALATADGEGLVGAIYAATATIFGATNGMPDTLWVAPDVWGAIGSLSDSTGRQLFPTVNPSNALGSISPTSMSGSVAGMRLVVDKHLPAGTAILGDSTYVETYETIGGQVSVIEPSVLGTQMAFYGYIAWLVLEAAAFVKITGVPVLPLSQGTNGNGGTPEPQNGGTYTGKATASTQKAGS